MARSGMTMMMRSSRSDGRLRLLAAWLCLTALALGGAALAQDAAQFAAALRSESVQERRDAAMALARLGEGAAPALPALLTAVSDADEETRYYALLALGEAGGKAPEVVPALSARLAANHSAAIRCAAAHALGRIGPAAAPAAPALAEMLRSHNERVRCTGATALAAIGEAAGDVLLAGLRNPDETVRLTVASALRGGPHDAGLRAAIDNASPAVALVGGSDVANGGFEADDAEIPGWSVALKDGAEGTFGVDNSVSCSGRRSLRLTKTNGIGWLDLHTTQPVTVPAGAEILTFRVHFHTEDASIPSLLLLRFEDEKGGFIADDSSVNRGAGWQSQSLLRNTPPGQWDRRLIMRRQGKEQRAYRLHIILYGNPCTVWVDDVAFPAPKWCGAATGPTVTRPVYTRDEALTILAERPEATARVVREGGRVRLLLDGKPAAPVLHLAVSPVHGDYHLFETEGDVRLQVLSISFDSNKGGFEAGKVRWPGVFPVWRTADKVDLTTPLAELEAFARRAPRSYLVLGFHIVWPQDYVDRNPDTVWLDAEGRRGCGYAVHFTGFEKELSKGRRWWPSPYSEKAKADAAAVMRQFLRELKKTPYAKMVAGTFISGGHDGQFYIGWRDYSPAGVAAWRAWLREKYGSDAALARAWQQPDATLDSASVPPHEKHVATGEGMTRMFHDPRRFAPSSDYNQFMCTHIWRIEEYFARVVKEELGKDVVALTWHMGGGWRGEFRTFLDSPVLDAFVAQPFYEYRQPGHIGGMNSPYESMSLHGKLAVKEMDTRSWLRGISNELITMRIGTPLSLDQFRATTRKEIGEMIARGHGYWWYDISGSTYRHPAAMAEIRAGRKVAEAVASRRDPFQPGVALVYHTRSFFWRRKSLYGAYNIPTYVHKWQHMCLKTAGVPTHGYYLRDLMRNPELPRYKVYVFLNAYSLTEAERAFINSLKRNGAVLVWHYAPGYLSEDAVSVDGVSELVGMTVETDVSVARQRALAVASDDPLARDLPPLQGVGDMLRSFFTLGPAPVAYLDAQRFWVTDAGAAPLARYASDERTAVAVRRFPDWTSVYVAAVGGLSAQLFHNIAREAGAFVATDPGPAVDMNGSFLSLHGVRGGSYAVRLPRTCDVVEAFTGRRVAAGVKQFRIDLPAQDTQWFLLE